MSSSRFVSPLLAVVLCSAAAVRAEAGQTRGGSAVGRAVPRTSVAPRRFVVAPRVVPYGLYRPYRPYYYPYRPGLSIGFYAGYPYGYSYGYPYAYSRYGYYGYSYPVAAYGTAVPGIAYGGVRIQGAPRDAQVFADGYYVGIVDDFDGTFQHLNLTAGPHRIEIRAPGRPPVAFDVRVEPGQTITYRADLTP